MNLRNKKIAFGLTSVFYAFDNTIQEMKNILEEGARIIPIMPIDTHQTDSKYGKAEEIKKKIEKLSKCAIITEEAKAEEIDSDIMVIAPCSRK